MNERGVYLRQAFLRCALPGDSYLNGLPAIRWLLDGSRLDLDVPVTFLVGENGTGKSTLLEGIAVACGFNPEGGTRNFSFSTRDTHSELGEYLTVSRARYPRDGFFLRAESFYNAASYLEEAYGPEFSAGIKTPYGDRSLHRRSHGEGFLALVQNRFSGHGLYLLDEPESALSPARLLTLMGQMRLLIQNDAQFIIATHSPILMAYPGARLYQLSEEGIEPVDYKRTEHYCLTRNFLNDPDRMLQYLFSGGDDGDD